MNHTLSHRSWTLVGIASLVTALAVALTVSLATSDGRPGRAKTIVLAAGICLAGSLGGWLAERASPADPARAVGFGLAAVGMRLFPALMALAWLQATGGGARHGDAPRWLVLFYLTLLATDVILHIVGPRKSGSQRDARTAN